VESATAQVAMRDRQTIDGNFDMILSPDNSQDSLVKKHH
jgi:hypothetical protein